MEKGELREFCVLSFYRHWLQRLHYLWLLQITMPATLESAYELIHCTIAGERSCMTGTMLSTPAKRVKSQDIDYLRVYISSTFRNIYSLNFQTPRITYFDYYIPYMFSN